MAWVEDLVARYNSRKSALTVVASSITRALVGMGAAVHKREGLAGLEGRGHGAACGVI